MKDADRILNYFKEHQTALLKVLQELVELESPSHENKEVSDRCSRYLQDLFKDLGFRIDVIPQTKCGNHFIAEYGSGEKGTLMVGHYDTVWPIGTTKERPFKIEGDRALGPGILDMKGGIILGYFAVKALKELSLLPNKKITFFISGDEESGSFLSSDLIVAEAKKNKNVLVLEPGNNTPGNVTDNELGIVKTGRYGRGTYRFTAHGRAAHSGTNPQDAISPMLELSHQMIKINAMNDYEKGFTLAPTVMASGIEGTCMVPETGWFSMDVRFRTAELSREKNEEILSMKPILPGIRLEIEGAIDKPPLISDPVLVSKIAALGKELGIELQGLVEGGGSDGNFTSAAGVPTICGFGMTGNYFHNPREYVILNHIPLRGAWLARTIQTL